MNEIVSRLKYFIPSIEDIRVGYECEIKRGAEWKLYTVSPLGLLQDLLSEVVIGDVRISYLTVEQIEKEGWEITHRETKEPPYQVDWINAKKGSYSLWINLALHKSMHLGINKDGILFRGQCKDINTFRYICKLLNIC